MKEHSLHVDIGFRLLEIGPSPEVPRLLYHKSICLIGIRKELLHYIYLTCPQTFELQDPFTRPFKAELTTTTFEVSHGHIYPRCGAIRPLYMPESRLIGNSKNRVPFVLGSSMLKLAYGPMCHKLLGKSAQNFLDALFLFTEAQISSIMEKYVTVTVQPKHLIRMKLALSSSRNELKHVHRH